jgi:hypothetical protein
MKHILLGLLLTCSLGVCSSAIAQDRYGDRGERDGYYDTGHKDYHQWNAKENRRFHEFLKEKHRKDHDWQHTSKREQQDYWQWRHEHESN